MIMIMTVVIGALIGAVLGLRFNVFILIPTMIIAAVVTAAIEVARADQGGSTLFAIVLVITAIQISYFIGCNALAVVERLVPIGRNAVSRAIQEHMEVVGSDGRHVGTVDHTEIADLIVLADDDIKAGGKPRLISVDWVDYVDAKVHLNKPSRKAVSKWRVAV
jgi:hypothetical protein